MIVFLSWIFALVYLNPCKNNNIDKKSQNSQNVIESYSFGKFACIFNHRWQACANIDVISVMVEDDIKNNLRDPAEDHHPQVNEFTPEFILESSRIFQPKNENVSCHYVEVYKHQCLGCQSKFQKVVEATSQSWQ